MNWVNCLERWLESLFARVFARRSQAVVGGNQVGDQNPNPEEGQAVLADRPQQPQVDSRIEARHESLAEPGAEPRPEPQSDVSSSLVMSDSPDSFVKQEPVCKVSEENMQNTNRFVLPSERKKNEHETVEDGTIRWKRPNGYILEVMNGSEPGARYRSVSETCLIGRSEDCDFVLSDATVSKHHAKISADGTGWLVEDLGSTNGTYVNGKLVSRVYLKSDDTLKLGLTELRFWSLENQQ